MTPTLQISGVTGAATNETLVAGFFSNATTLTLQGVSGAFALTSPTNRTSPSYGYNGTVSLPTFAGGDLFYEVVSGTAATSAGFANATAPRRDRGYYGTLDSSGSIAGGVNVAQWGGVAVPLGAFPMVQPLATVYAGVSAGQSSLQFAPSNVAMPPNFDCTFTVGNALSPVTYTGTVRAGFGQAIYTDSPLQSSVLAGDVLYFSRLDPTGFTLTPAALAAVGSAAAAAATGAGTGNVAVNQNTGGTGNLMPTVNGIGVGYVVVNAYLQSDYAAGNLGPAYVRGQATTDTSGNWASPMKLAAGTYAFIFNSADDVFPPKQNVVIS